MYTNFFGDPATNKENVETAENPNNLSTEETPTKKSRIETDLKGSFSIINIIGEGTVGTVYLATHKSTGRQVAIKTITPETQQTERLNNEISVLSELDHPNIQAYFGCGMLFNNTAMITMFCNSGDLFTFIETGNKSPKSFYEDAIKALAYLHEHGIIHRDVKPENFFIHDGFLILADLDHAIKMDEYSPKMAGTYGYIPPEVLKNDNNGRGWSDKADIYALAVVFHLMLARRFPYTREDSWNGRSNPALAQETLANNIFLSRSTVEPLVIMSKLLRAMLAKEPTARPAITIVEQTFGDNAKILTAPALR